MLFILATLATKYVQPRFTYTVANNEQAIGTAITKMIHRPVEIRLTRDIDNKRIILFTNGSQIGEAEFTRGPNRKLKLKSAGYGTNEVRDRILTTNKGQYVKILGRNTANISSIHATVESKTYKLTVPQGIYFIVDERLTKKTKTSFPSEWVGYDAQGQEISSKR